MSNRYGDRHVTDDARYEIGLDAIYREFFSPLRYPAMGSEPVAATHAAADPAELIAGEPRGSLPRGAGQ